MLEDPTFWALTALVIFIAILWWRRVPGLVMSGLDKRIDQIATELDKARDLREQAQTKLADAERLHGKAESEAAAILEAARKETERAAQQAHDDLEQALQRRKKMAEKRIARASEEAVDDIRRAAIDAAILISEEILRKNMDATEHQRQLQKSLEAAEKLMTPPQ